MAAVAAENNLAETAFVLLANEVVPLRWFTPAIEVDLCGHATLASAHVLWEDGHLPATKQARFYTRSGLLLAAASMVYIVRLERQTRGRYYELARSRYELQLLSSRLVDAQETERRSISRELHDEVGQSLTGVRVELANLSQRIRMRDTQGAEDKAGEIKELVEESLGVVRNMALLLRPSMLDDLGLVPALQWQGREVSKRTGLRFRVAADVNVRHVPYRGPVEALTDLMPDIRELFPEAGPDDDPVTLLIQSLFAAPDVQEPVGVP